MSKPTDLRAVYAGFYAKFLADSALKTAVGYTVTYPGFYFNQPVTGATFPHIIYTMQDNTAWDHIGAGSVGGEYVIIQLNIFSKKYPDSNEVIAIEKELTRVYDEATLTMTGYLTVRCERVFHQLLPQPVEALFNNVFRYRLFVQKT